MKKLFLFSAACSLLFSASAQSGWDLQQCIQYAIKHNISLIQSSLGNEMNKNNLNRSKAALFPNLNLGTNHVQNYGQTIDRFTNQFANTKVLSQSFFLSSSFTIWSGLNQFNTMKSNEYTYLSGLESQKQSENDLSLNIANAYISVIFTEELNGIAKNQFEITKEQFERTKKLVDAGSLAKSNEYDIKAQLANEELNVTTTENNYQLAMLNLVQLMNLDSSVNFSIVRPRIDIEGEQQLNYTVLDVYESALSNQPSIKSSSYAIKSAEKSLAASKGRLSPSINFNASTGTGTSGLAEDIVSTTYVPTPIGSTSSGDIVYAPIAQYQTKLTPFNEQFKNNFNRSAGISISFPIFNGLANHTAIKNAELNLQSNRLQQDLVKQNLYKTITQAYANAKAALNKYFASKASVEAAGESFKYARQKYDAGAISAFDYNNAKTRLMSAESNLLQAKYDYIFKLKVLDYYQGKTLTF
ncbi:MAG TPA: TolC family protein [Bacteroidia bacterium]|nr:TolC family protein [Bacteroidia bacterium]